MGRALSSRPLPPYTAPPPLPTNTDTKARIQPSLYTVCSSYTFYITRCTMYILHSSPTRPTKRRLVCRKACSSQRFYVRLIQTIKPSPSTQYINVIHYVSCHRHYKIYSVYYTIIQARFDLTQTRANSTLPPHWNVASQ